MNQEDTVDRGQGRRQAPAPSFVEGRPGFALAIAATNAVLRLADLRRQERVGRSEAGWLLRRAGEWVAIAPYITTEERWLLELADDVAELQGVAPLVALDRVLGALDGATRTTAVLAAVASLLNASVR